MRVLARCPSHLPEHDTLSKKKATPPTKRAKKTAHKTRNAKTQREKPKTKEQVKRAERRAFLQAQRERLQRREQRRAAREKAERAARKEFKKRSDAAKKAWANRRARTQRGREKPQRKQSGQWRTIFQKESGGSAIFYMDVYDGLIGTKEQYNYLRTKLITAIRGWNGKIVDSEIGGRYSHDGFVTSKHFTVRNTNRVIDSRETARALYLHPMQRFVRVRGSDFSYITDYFRLRLSASKRVFPVPYGARHSKKKTVRERERVAKTRKRK